MSPAWKKKMSKPARNLPQELSYHSNHNHHSAACPGAKSAIAFQRLVNQNGRRKINLNSQ
jgi:hypothetical protein